MKWRENGKMKRKWRKIHSLQFLILSLFTPSLSISYIEICHSLAENVRYGSFVTNVTRKLNRKLVWVEFAARKLRKLCRPAQQFYTYYCQAFWQHSIDLEQGRILLTVIRLFNCRHWLLREDFLKISDQILSFLWTLCSSSALENRDITGGWRRPICPGGWQVLIIHFFTQRTAIFQKPIGAVLKYPTKSLIG